MPLKMHTVTVRRPSGFICDHCGKSDEELGVAGSAYLHISHRFGYGSPHDGSLLDVVLCDFCAEKIPALIAPGTRII